MDLKYSNFSSTTTLANFVPRTHIGSSISSEQWDEDGHGEPRASGRYNLLSEKLQLIRGNWQQRKSPTLWNLSGHNLSWMDYCWGGGGAHLHLLIVNCPGHQMIVTNICWRWYLCGANANDSRVAAPIASAAPFILWWPLTISMLPPTRNIVDEEWPLLHTEQKKCSRIKGTWRCLCERGSIFTILR